MTIEIDDYKEDLEHKKLVRAIQNSSLTALTGGVFSDKRWNSNLNDIYVPEEDNFENPEVSILGDAWKQNWFITKARMNLWDKDILGGEQYNPDKEELKAVYKEFHGDMDTIRALYNGATCKEDLEHRKNVLKERIAYREQAAKEGVILNVVGGLMSGITDPTSYIPVVGATGLAGRVITGAMAGALSNQLDHWVSGTEADIMEDIGVGAAIGLGFELGFKGLGGAGKAIGHTVNNAKLIQEAQLKGVDVDTEKLKGGYFATQSANLINNLVTRIDSKLPVWSIRNYVQKSPSQELRDLGKRIYRDNGEGHTDVLTADTVSVASKDKVAEEFIRDSRNSLDTFEGQIYKNRVRLLDQGYSEETIDKAITAKLDYPDSKTQLDEVPEFEETVSAYRKEIANQSLLGEEANYSPRIYSTDRVDEALDATGSTNRQAAKQLVADDLTYNLQDQFDNVPEVRAAATKEYTEEVHKPLVEAQQKKVEEAQNKLKAESKKVNKAHEKYAKDQTNYLKRSSTYRGHVRAVEHADKDLKTLTANQRRETEQFEKGLVKKNLEVDNEYEKAVKKSREAHQKAQAKTLKRKDSPHRAQTIETQNARLEKRLQDLRERHNARKLALKEKAVKNRKALKEKHKESIAKHKEAVERSKKAIAEAEAKLKERIEQHKANHVVKPLGERLGKVPHELPEEPNPADVRAWYMDRAKKDAYGIIDHNDSKSTFRNPSGAGMIYNPHRSKMPYKSDWVPKGGDKGRYNLNHFRTSPREALRAYSRRMTGDKIVQSLGFNTREEFLDYLQKIERDLLDNYNLNPKERKKAQDALRMLHDQIYSRVGAYGIDNDSWVAALAELLRQLTFMSKNAFMGIMNMFEQGEAIKRYGALMMIKSIPGMEFKFNNIINGNLSEAERRAGHVLTFGLSQGRVKCFKEIWTDSIDANLRRFHGDRAKAMLVGPVSAIAKASPFTKLIQSTENSIVGASQQMFLGELIHHVHGFTNRSGKGFITKETLLRNSIDPEAWGKLELAVKRNSKVAKNGKIDFDYEGFLSDADAAFTLRRIGDYIADEVIQRHHFGDAYIQDHLGGNEFFKLLMQFKSFALKSWDKQIMKKSRRAAAGDALGQGYSAFLASALGVLNVVTVTGLNVAAMNEEQREKYLKYNFGYTKEEGFTSSVAVNLVNAGLIRSSLFAAPAMLMSGLGIGTGLKTTNAKDYGRSEEQFYKGFSLDSLAQSNLPAYGTGRSALNSFIYGFVNNIMVDTSDMSPYQIEANNFRFYRALRSLSNIPFYKWIVTQIEESTTK